MTPQTRPQPWPWVLGLVGLDYFSTLGYQPSLAYEAAGRLAPLATVVVVFVTLVGALPVYAYVVGRSPHGQGSLALLERLVPGWKGKLLIVVLLGFAATDFVFMRTLSAADAAEHLVHNPNPHWQQFLEYLFAQGSAAGTFSRHPYWQKALTFWNKQMVVTVLLLLLGFIFWAVFRKGFTRNALRVAAAVVGIYVLLSVVVISSGLVYLLAQPDTLERWWQQVLRGDWGRPVPFAGPGLGAVLAACLFVLPKMALGLSGFEMSMVVMPLVGGGKADTPEEPRGRVRNTRKLLVAAAVVMSLLLLGSSLVTAVLIPPAAFTTGQASNRALAYLAHGGPLAHGPSADTLNPLFGYAFGTLYDFATVSVLCLAGASVAIGLRDFVPPYLHRLGMEMNWTLAVGALLYLFNLIKLIVTVVSHASVAAQRGAYATSVLVLMAAAAGAAALDRRRRGSRAAGPVLVAVLFGGTALTVVATQPAGFLIALAFLVALLLTSIFSRLVRSTELRFHGFVFADAPSRFLWESLQAMDFPVLVPHRPGRRSLAAKEDDVRRRHRLTPDVPVVFVEVELGDVSDFEQVPLLEVKQEEGRFLVRIGRCASVAHVLAAAGLELSKHSRPPEMHFGWSDERPMAANLGFVFFGQGNVPWLVHELLRRAESDSARRPRVVIG